jgi:predicted AAA+ superfamily ATPase
MRSPVRRLDLEARLRGALRSFPVTLLLGPRQCGKTTLARLVAKTTRSTYFDLEDPATPLQPASARLTLAGLKGLVVIDEFQRQPTLFELLRVLADRRPRPARFLLLGSASPDLVRGVSESLAGRVAYVEMGGFSLNEVGAARFSRLWLRGGFPDSFLAPSEATSRSRRAHFVRSFLERDIPQLGFRVPAQTLRRFWTMLAHYHGQIWNAAELARALGTKEDTARRYLDILCGAFVARQLSPWFQNVGKRLVKAPKVYLRDSGILHTLLDIEDRMHLLSHPKLGASWEGFALEQVIRIAAADRDAYYYRTHAGAELDLLLVRRGRRYGFEFKHEDAPKITKSVRIAMGDLALKRLWVVHPGEHRYPLGDRVEAVPLRQIGDVLGHL